MGIAGQASLTKKIQYASNCELHKAYNQTMDLNTTLPLIWIPVYNSVSLKSLAVIEVANPKAIAMQYSLLLKDNDEEILQHFIKFLEAGIINWHNFSSNSS